MQERERETMNPCLQTFIKSSSYGALGAVILVISLVHEATMTFTSSSGCSKNFFSTIRFIVGRRASNID